MKSHILKKQFQEMFIVRGDTPEDLVKQCNEILKNGDWIIHGHVFEDSKSNSYTQYMVRTVTVKLQEPRVAR